MFSKRREPSAEGGASERGTPSSWRDYAASWSRFRCGCVAGNPLHIQSTDNQILLQGAAAVSATRLLKSILAILAKTVRHLNALSIAIKCQRDKSVTGWFKEFGRKGRKQFATGPFMTIDSSGTVSVTNATSTDIGTLSSQHSFTSKTRQLTSQSELHWYVKRKWWAKWHSTSSARVSALASGGVGVFDADLVFETRSGSSIAERMRISHGAVQIGPDSIQGGALLGVRRMGDSFNFGHINGAGYGSNLGCGNNNGHPYVAFSCEHGTNNNTFKTESAAMSYKQQH